MNIAEVPSEKTLVFEPFHHIVALSKKLAALGSEFRSAILSLDIQIELDPKVLTKKKELKLPKDISPEMFSLKALKGNDVNIASSKVQISNKRRWMDKEDGKGSNIKARPNALPFLHQKSLSLG